MKTIAYIMSTYHIGTHNSDIRDVLKSYIIARYYGWEPKEEDLEEIISHTSYLKSFIQDKDQAEEMITQYTCYYNAIKRWESNHKKTEILHQLEISNLLEQLKNN